ncbi:hypothetical protein [Bradyrhizobium genosp. P]|uniref:hypothetical protein n=1 Tax=Bradyrhizobium genosp. P TaxID=83641 RepID=UPI003CF915DE
MNSTTDDKLEDEQIARLEEQLSNLMSEAGISPSNPPTSKRTFHRPGNNSSTGGWALLGAIANFW